MLTNGTGSKMLRFNAVNALMTSEAVKLDSAVKGIKAHATLRTFTNSGTGFESDDTLRVAVDGSPDGISWTELGSIIPTLSGTDATTPNPAGIDQLLVKAGPGTFGEPLPKSRLGWAAKGYGTGPATDSLTVPTFTVPDATPVQLEFTHRYSFELDTDGVRWDGGDVQISINEGAFAAIPGTAFTAHGYDGIVTGNHALINLEAFNGDSPGYSTGDMITSVLTIPGLSPGDKVQVQFVGAWDEFTANPAPNWEINDIKVKSGATTLYSENFSTGDGGLIPTPGWVFDNGSTNTGPVYYNFNRFAIPVAAGVQFVRMRLFEPRNVVLSTSEFFLIDNLKLEVGLDPLADQDGDGVSNGLEDVAGTNPADTLSAFKVASQIAPVAGNPGTWRGTFDFPAADFRVWKLQASDDLNTWTDVDTRYGDPAIPTLSLFGDSTTPKKYWRISIGY